MFEPKFGDICLCDLSLSINSTKTGFAPLLFLSDEKDASGNSIYKLCRIGRRPALTTTKPFIPLDHQPPLRRDSAAYPTQTVEYLGLGGIVRMIGSLTDAELISEIKATHEEYKIDRHKALVMALCPCCRRNFLADPGLKVKRIKPFSFTEYQCDFCQTRNGHMYAIFRRKLYGGTNR